VRFREKRDGRALAAVFDATARELIGVAAHLVPTADQAEDVVQTTSSARSSAPNALEALEALEALADTGGLVLDLRFNGGGGAAGWTWIRRGSPANTSASSRR
jgi:hypothetical protein